MLHYASIDQTKITYEYPLRKSQLLNIYTVFHALSHGTGGKYSFFQEDGELTWYHHRYFDLEHFGAAGNQVMIKISTTSEQ